MRARVVEIYQFARSSFWFLPAFMMLAGVLLFAVTLAVDQSAYLRANSSTLFYSGGASNAINLLQTLTGAMVAIATVVFSTLMLVLTLATSQFGHRLIRSFMRDRANQAVLGIFLSTFVYCMLVFHMVGNDPSNHFVPGFSITVGFGLALFATGTLIYFTHHMASLIAAPEVLETVAVELDAAIDNVYPDDDSDDASSPTLDSCAQDHIRAHGGGYIQAVDIRKLTALAADPGVVIESRVGYGDYVLPGNVLACVHGGTLSDDAKAQAAGYYLFGNNRLTGHDLLFATNQVAEIAVRALSPALNDPFTAVDCINRLGLSLARLAHRPLPSGSHYHDHRLRLVFPVPGFDAVLDAAFIPIRNYGRTSVLTSREMLRVITKLAPLVRRESESAALRAHAHTIREAARNGLSEENDKARIETFYEHAIEALNTARGHGSS